MFKYDKKLTFWDETSCDETAASIIEKMIRNQTSYLM